MNTNLMVSSSPHLRDKAKTSTIMGDVIIALLPALAIAGYIFGVSALLLVATCIISCVGFEYITNIILKQPQSVKDCSALVTGILLGFNLPANLPIWMAVIGSFVAIVIVKMLFGGLGKNFANPAIVGRIVLFVSFASPMANYPTPFAYQQGNPIASVTPIIAGPTPLATLKDSFANDSFASLPSMIDMLLGFKGGVLGETCVVALVLGGIYLVIRKVISPIVPLSFIGTVYLGTMLAGSDPVYQILSGGLMLGAIFMATDYVTSPLSPKGKLVFGIGCGLITVAIRLYGGYPEGVSFAILLMNIITPFIDKYTRTRIFGGVTHGK